MSRGVDVAGHGIGPRDFGAGLGMIGLNRQRALQREDGFGKMTRIDRRQPKHVVEFRIVGAFGSLRVEQRISFARMACLQQRGRLQQRVIGSKSDGRQGQRANRGNCTRKDCTADHSEPPDLKDR